MGTYLIGIIIIIIHKSECGWKWQHRQHYIRAPNRYLALTHMLLCIASNMCELLQCIRRNNTAYSYIVHWLAIRTRERERKRGRRHSAATLLIGVERRNILSTSSLCDFSSLLCSVLLFRAFAQLCKCVQCICASAVLLCICVASANQLRFNVCTSARNSILLLLGYKSGLPFRKRFYNGTRARVYLLWRGARAYPFIGCTLSVYLCV